MKKIMNNISPKSVWCTLKYVFGLLVGLAIIYSFALAPLMAKQDRVACHEETFVGAQQLGAQVLEQNQDNPDLTEQQVQQEVNALVAQAYEANYVICLRSKGL